MRTSQRSNTSREISLGPTLVRCWPGSSHSARSVGPIESVQVATMSAPATAASGLSTASTSTPSLARISAAYASRWAVVGL